MATIIRTRATPSPPTLQRRQKLLDLDASVPTPFPTKVELEQEELLQELEGEELLLEEEDPFDERYASIVVGNAKDDITADNQFAAGSATDAKCEEMIPTAVQSVLLAVQGRAQTSEDLMPSIAQVQKSCLMTLNDLLSTSPTWRPIIPDRRHSMPARAASSNPSIRLEPSCALHTLVLNLRAQKPDSEHAVANSSSNVESDDASLIRELQTRIEQLIDMRAILARDAELVRTLASLIGHFRRLSVLQPSTSSPSVRRVSWESSDPTAGPSDPLANLRRQLSDFQMAHEDAMVQNRAASPVAQVETALLWTQINEELEHVNALCRARTSDSASIAYTDSQHLPPEYENAWYDLNVDAEGLPQYEPGLSYLNDETKASTSHKLAETSHADRMAPSGSLSEKMRMDFEAVTMAIDRLYLVAPQLHDQRVELKKSKLAELERASHAKPSSSRSGVREGKQRAKDEDVKELERMLDMIGRASERKMINQAVVLEGGMQAQLEKARRREMQKKEDFVAQLVHHSDAGRLHSQDAIHDPTRPRTKDPEALLSLPEFIREAIPEQLQLKMQMDDPHALLTLPEFMKEPVPKGMDPPPPLKRSHSTKGLRNRSMSAPPLAWLLSSRPSSPSSLNPSSPVETKKAKSYRLRKMGSSSAVTTPLQAPCLEVNYVAEYHENLQHVLMFLTAAGITPGAEIEAEVFPASVVPIGAQGDGGCDCLLLRCGPSISSFLRLPARVAPGRQPVKAAGSHYEIKLAVDTSASSSLHSVLPALLDASHLSVMRPTSYVCAACSLPLVQCAQISAYRDLPSEHWAELVDAWMCHGDQKLHEHVTKHSNEGFWPSGGNALVGGSYILFEEGAIVKQNLRAAEDESRGKMDHIDDWQRIRCLCGSIVGRSRERPTEDSPNSVTYRLAKYAIRPVSASSEPCRIPLSAFVAEDMNEFVHAHATYRFVILDEQEERPRILIWLFKPSMRIAYMTPTEYVIPKSGCIPAAKVLYKLLDPVALHSPEFHSILNKYPGFPQAEHLYYPLDVCMRLKGVLRQSSTAYPEGMRTMTGLDVGWLQRV